MVPRVSVPGEVRPLAERDVVGLLRDEGGTAVYGGEPPALSDRPRHVAEPVHVRGRRCVSPRRLSSGLFLRAGPIRPPAAWIVRSALQRLRGARLGQRLGGSAFSGRPQALRRVAKAAPPLDTGTNGRRGLRLLGLPFQA